MVGLIYSVALALSCSTIVTAFPPYKSLAGLSRDELSEAMSSFDKRLIRAPPVPPGPLAFGGTKLVNDAAHPYQAPGPNDIRGPCPALNALASHGYINRNGIASPSQIVQAVMEGFNMENSVAIFTTYAAFLTDGNIISDLISIGGASSLTGTPPDPPATASGFNTHNMFEGDTSMTRGDAYFGDNHSFNETLFQQFIDYSNQYGGGKYNLTVASEFRAKRFHDSMMTNPQFTIVAPRFFTAYNDGVLPVNLFVDGRRDDGQLDMVAARNFFGDGRFPTDFYRAARPTGVDNKIVMMEAHPMQPGGNVNGVNTYAPDPSTPQGLMDVCAEYTYHVNVTVRSLYPDPDGTLINPLRANLNYLYSSVKGAGCTQVFPYGNF